ncbi:DUF805 domain-containing protein [Archangium violaceum]|uniref:DUF805 domain-containing protein n=1 Tax=Archangium violaceum TaxID=83451 RepID=UPI00195233EA|nr:DUF805 domain-containing protein [Archangium violaceum]QRN97586.1 DUF805 domain-containing protein [Archangium violaceum]
MDWKTLFLTPQGRIGRRDFWIGFLIVMVASAVLQIIPFIGQLLGLLLFWPQICIHSKRLHDMGKSAWLLLAPFIVSVICVGVSIATGSMAMMGAARVNESGGDASSAGNAMAAWGAAMGFMALGFLVGFAFLLWVGLSKGQPGLNRFGPPPVSLTGATS